MKEVKLTEGPIFMKLLTFSIPMIAGNMLQQVYNIVDTLIVGRVLGADALASVGSVYTLMIFQLLQECCHQAARSSHRLLLFLR